MKRRTVVAALAAATVIGGKTMAADLKAVAVIGTGRMGGAFGKTFAAAGYKVVYGSRTPRDAKVQAVVNATPGSTAVDQQTAAADASIIILATPWTATEATVKALGDLRGKLILDPTNAIEFGKDGAGLAVSTSGGELVRDWAPGASVVKAFNTVGYFVIAEPNVLGDKVAVFLASDDAVAKARVAEIVTALGFEAVDVGVMKAARTLEGMSTLYMVPYFNGQQDQRFEWAVRRSGNVKLGPVRAAK
jgi:predicted dinucleotide-binding enzyme